MLMNILKIVGTQYDFEYTLNIINLLIKKDESNREIIEKELSKMIDKKNKKDAENLKKWNSIEYQKGYDLKDSSCIGGQLSPSNDNDWLR
jgi:hypothetical protein